MRSTYLLFNPLAALCVINVRGVVEVEEHPSRILQDQSICEELRANIEVNSTGQDIQDSCDCSEMDNGDTRLACRRNNICLSSDGGDPMQGDFSAVFTRSGEGLSFSAPTVIEYCFDYPSDMYGGNKVCVSSLSDGLGTANTCSITVGSDACAICRYCPINLISFDCSNLGYEDRTACGDNNTDDSVLQFLYSPELVTGCSGGGGGSGGDGSSAGTPSPSMPTTPSPTGGGVVANAIVAIVFGLLPMLLMG